MKKKDKSVSTLIIILILLIIAVAVVLITNFKTFKDENSNTVNNNVTNNNQTVNNEIENNTTVNGNIENNLPTTNVDPNAVNETKPDTSKMTDEELAIYLAKEEWGTGQGIYFTINSKKSENEYIVSVSNSETTEVLQWYTVDIKAKTVK